MADKIAFTTDSDTMFADLQDLKNNYANVSCQIVKEMFYGRNVIWHIRYFGTEAMYSVSQHLASNGIFMLFKNLWEFKDKRKALKKHSEEGISEEAGNLQNIQIAFQLYFICIAVSI